MNVCYEKAPRYICSYAWGYIPSEEILNDCNYYVEVKNIDKHELGCLRRCSMGSKSENAHLGNMFRDNEIHCNITK